MDKVTLNLSIENLNIVMAALARMPYEAVFSLIEDLKNQINAQLQPPQQPPQQ